MKYADTRHRTQYYVDGNTVRKLEAAPARRERTAQPQPKQRGTAQEESQRRRASQSQPQRKKAAQPKQRKKQQEKVAPMNIGYISVMTAAIVIVCVVLMGYIKLQSDITNHISNISKLESELYELQISNDEYYTKIMSSVDLEEIKRIAISELGMKYAKEGQVINYTSEGSDYVRQFSVIPSE